MDRLRVVSAEATAHRRTEFSLSPVRVRLARTTDDRFGGDCSASLSLLACDLGRADYDTVIGEDGEELDVSDFVGFRPWERGAPDDYVVRTNVKE